MAEECIKGAVLVAVTDDLCRLVEAGRVSRDALEARLEARDIELLDSKVQLALWYPIDSYDRLLQALVDVDGGSDPVEFLRNRGRKAAARLAAAGVYVQLRGDGKPYTLDLAQVKRTLSLWSALVNFSQFCCELESDAPRVLRIDVTEARKFSALLRHANTGFLEAVFSGLAQRSVSVAIEDERPERFSYRVRVPA
jgi:hypothetical protein